jgi:hypothetical protein
VRAAAITLAWLTLVPALLLSVGCAHDPAGRTREYVAASEAWTRATDGFTLAVQNDAYRLESGQKALLSPLVVESGMRISREGQALLDELGPLVAEGKSSERITASLVRLNSLAAQLAAIYLVEGR